MQSRQYFYSIEQQTFSCYPSEQDVSALFSVDMNENSSNSAGIHPESETDPMLTSLEHVHIESKHYASSAADMLAAVVAQPMRRLRPSSGPAPKPKRFFRTFWRGLAMRAMAVDALKNSMNE